MSLLFPLLRIKALASTIGIPARLLQSFLQLARSKQLRLGDEDDSEELLYTKDVLNEPHSIVDRLGTSAAERGPALIKIAAAIASQRQKYSQERGDIGEQQVVVNGIDYHQSSESDGET